MLFYDKYILPRLLDLAMRHKEVARYRAQIVPQARGIVLEVGIGSGLNLPFYGEQVERLFAVDPSPELLRMAKQKAPAVRFALELRQAGGEKLPFGDQSVDTVVTTFTLCTVAEPLDVLREMKRVLRPGGNLLFAEHGLAPEASVQLWQHRLNPLWKKFTGGCNLDRNMDALVSAAGFRMENLTRKYAKGPRPLSYVYAGTAVPR